jgi:hypothetical protein
MSRPINDDQDVARERELGARPRQYSDGRPNETVSLGRAIGEDDEPGREVPCMDCGAPTMISATGWWCAKAVSVIAARQGWEPIQKHELTRCDDCRQRHEDDRVIDGNRRYWRAQDLLERVRADRASNADHHELRELGYGDALKGVQAALERATDAAAKKRKGKSHPTAETQPALPLEPGA